MNPLLSIPKKHPKEPQLLNSLNQEMSLGETPLENVSYVYSKERNKYVPYVSSTQKQVLPPKHIRRPEEIDPGVPFLSIHGFFVTGILGFTCNTHFSSIHSFLVNFTMMA